MKKILLFMLFPILLFAQWDHTGLVYVVNDTTYINKNIERVIYYNDALWYTGNGRVNILYSEGDSVSFTEISLDSLLGRTTDSIFVKADLVTLQDVVISQNPSGEKFYITNASGDTVFYFDANSNIFKAMGATDTTSIEADKIQISDGTNQTYVSTDSSQINGVILKNDKYLNLHENNIISGDTLFAFGNSTTLANAGVSVADSAYVNRIGKSTGWIVKNEAISGSRLHENVNDIYDEKYAKNSRSLFFAGVNNLVTTINSAWMKHYKKCLMAVSAYMSIPDCNKKYAATDFTDSTKTWAATPVNGNIGLNSSELGATLTFKVRGDVVYISYVTIPSSAGQFTVTIDNDVIGTYDCDDNNFFPGVVGYSSELIRYELTQSKEHTIVITQAESGKEVYIDWVAGNGGNNYAAGPYAYIGGMIKCKYTGDYAPGNDSLVSAYNDTIKTAIQMLASDGLNVAFVDVNGYYEWNADVYSDSLHPDDSGHRHIAEAFLSKMTGLHHASGRGVADYTDWTNTWRDLKTSGSGRFDTNTLVVNADSSKVGILNETPSTTIAIGDNLFKTDLKYLSIGSTTGSCGFAAGQSSSRYLAFDWVQDATPANAFARFSTSGYSNPVKFNASKVVFQDATSNSVDVGTPAVVDSNLNIDNGVYIGGGLNVTKSVTLSGNAFLNAAPTWNFLTDTSSVDDDFGAVEAKLTGYETGMKITFVAQIANTDAATFQLNALGAKTIKKMHDQDIVTGDIESGQVVEIVYDGTNFQMTSQLAQ